MWLKYYGDLRNSLRVCFPSILCEIYRVENVLFNGLKLTGFECSFMSCFWNTVVAAKLLSAKVYLMVFG